MAKRMRPSEYNALVESAQERSAQRARERVEAGKPADFDGYVKMRMRSIRRGTHAKGVIA